MYSFDSKVRYSEVDYNGNMTLHGIVDYFQDCSSFQSDELGIGRDYMGKKKIAWILISWQVIVERYPVCGEKITVGTWPYEFKGFYGYRNFLMKDKEEKVVAYANSVWALWDVVKGKPIRILPEIQEAYQIEAALSMKCESRKIEMPLGMKSKKEFDVQKFHLDTNGHVNNGKYILMAMEYLPEKYKVKQMRAEYKKSALYGEVIRPFVTVENEKVTIVLKDKEEKPFVIVECKEEQ